LTAPLAAIALILAAMATQAAVAGARVAPPGRAIAVKTALFEFAYSYPAAAGRIPALKAWLDKDAARQRREISKAAREGRAAAKASGFPFNPYSSDAAWEVVADLPGWLSLSGMVGDYSGGAHPNHGPTALLWDKARNRRLKALDLFVSPQALSAATRAPFCAALNRQRAEKRGGETPDPKGLFGDCLDPTEQVIILGSSDRAHFNRIGVLMGPYVAGPYVEGDYEVTLPVTDEVLAAVKPQYRNAFALGR
jgi:hypothetical protein